jgi:hypothetical protein
MTEYCIAVLGLGDEQISPLRVVWKDSNGTPCRGILGSYPDVPEEPQPPDNIVSFNEFKERKKNAYVRPL